MRPIFTDEASRRPLLSILFMGLPGISMGLKTPIDHVVILGILFLQLDQKSMGQSDRNCKIRYVIIAQIGRVPLGANYAVSVVSVLFYLIREIVEEIAIV